jgi:hypothetical protein
VKEARCNVSDERTTPPPGDLVPSVWASPRAFASVSAAREVRISAGPAIGTASRLPAFNLIVGTLVSGGKSFGTAMSPLWRPYTSGAESLEGTRKG